MRGQEHLGQFSRVDEASDPRAFVTLLDQLLLQAVERKRRTYRMMQVRTGDRVLDVGCGTGEDVKALSELVGPKGRAVGIDQSDTMVREARERCKDIAATAKIEQGDARALPFRARMFDACRCERLLEHIEQPERVIREMVRVVKPGARIVAYEPDWGTAVIDVPDLELAERVKSSLGGGIRSGRIGRQLLRLFRDAGLDQVQVDADVWTITNFKLAAQLLRLEDALNSAREAASITSAEIDAFLGWAREAGEKNRFLGSLTFFYATGVKPMRGGQASLRRERPRARKRIRIQTPSPPIV